MTQHFWVTGTDTDVGKTFVTSYFMRYFQSKGKKVIPYKPVQTGVTVGDSTLVIGDTEIYQFISEEVLNKEHLNTYSFKEPASPHYAAALEGKQINENAILQHIDELKKIYEVVICEGAGGLFVPIDEKRNYHFLHLIVQSKLPVVLVARCSLGTINHTLLSIESLKMNQIPIAGIVLNGYEGTQIERNNIETINSITNIPTLVIPKLKSIREMENILEDNVEFFERLLLV